MATVLAGLTIEESDELKRILRMHVSQITPALWERFLLLESKFIEELERKARVRN